MSTPLVQRLRAANSPSVREMCSEAADAIERLERELADREQHGYCVNEDLFKYLGQGEGESVIDAAIRVRRDQLRRALLRVGERLEARLARYGSGG